MWAASTSVKLGFKVLSFKSASNLAKSASNRLMCLSTYKMKIKIRCSFPYQLFNYQFYCLFCYILTVLTKIKIIKAIFESTIIYKMLRFTIANQSFLKVLWNCFWASGIWNNKIIGLFLWINTLFFYTRTTLWQTLTHNINKHL